MVRQRQRLHLRRGCMDINECVHMRNSFVAVTVTPCEWAFSSKQTYKKFLNYGIIGHDALLCT